MNAAHCFVRNVDYNNSANIQLTRPLRQLSMSASKSYYLTLTSHQDRPGISAAVSKFLADHKLNILESAQYGDSSTSKFFMRNHFAVVDGSSTLTEMQELKDGFGQVAKGLDSQFEIHRAEEKPNVLLSERYLTCATTLS